MCMREYAEQEISKNADLTRKVTKIDESLEETNRKLGLVWFFFFFFFKAHVGTTEVLQLKSKRFTAYLCERIKPRPAS